MKNIFIILCVLLTASFFSGYSDSDGRFRYEDVNDKVIKRTDLSNNTYVLYMKGEVILKFKTHLNISTDGKKFGINKLDNILNDNSVLSTEQRYKIAESKRNSLKMIKDIENVYTIKFESGQDPIEMAYKIYIENADILEFADVNVVYESDYIPNDPNINQQYHLSRILAYSSWDYTKGDTNVVIGIVDSGNDMDHPDLAANIKYNYNDPVNGIDDDLNGYTDDWRGWDFIGDGSAMDNDPSIFGNNCDHGSHVAGCASQVTDNGVHGAGIGFKTKLLISKHGNDNDFSGAGGTSLIYNSDQGIFYTGQLGANVINCSYGSSFFSGTTQNVVNIVWGNGAVIVASAGNQNVNQPRYPASYDNVVNVAATNSGDIKASFSNYHSTVDVSAPGDGIISTLWNNTYANYSGTSMSSPIAAGLVALIKAKNPTWNNTQLVNRLVLAVDSIYNLNPGFVGNLGSGRINALKAVSDLPLISLTSSVASDSLLGNRDGVFEANEQVTIQVNYKNTWLAGTNAVIKLTTTNPHVEIIKDSITIGNVAAYSTGATTVTNTFIVRAKPTCPFDQNVTFNLVNTTSANGDPNSSVTIKFRQGFATHNVNNLQLSMTRDGAIGKKSENYGTGLAITGTTGNNIFEGGFMIGNSNTKVSDVSRRASGGAFSDTDFVSTSVYSLTTPGIYSAQDGITTFTDDGAGSNKLGVTVEARSFAFNTVSEQNYIILRYRIKNTSGGTLSNLYAGTFMFYQPGGVITNNTVTVDTLNRLGYTFNNNASLPHLGVSLLTNQTLNFSPVVGTNVTNGFTTEEKWQALSSGVNMTPLGPGINSMCISAGPFTLNNNEETVVAFAILKGSDLNDIKLNATLARTKYLTIPISVEQISSLVPDKFELNQNYPNPFNPETIIKFSIAKSSVVKLNIFDVAGREVAKLVDNELTPGVYEYAFNGSGLSSGVYFYRLETGFFTETKRMVLIK